MFTSRSLSHFQSLTLSLSLSLCMYTGAAYVNANILQADYKTSLHTFLTFVIWMSWVSVALWEFLERPQQVEQSALTHNLCVQRQPEKCGSDNCSCCSPTPSPTLTQPRMVRPT